MKASATFLALAKKHPQGLLKQITPDIRELVSNGMRDPLAEENHSPIPGIVHRYTRRALLLTTNTCFSYCRFCTRKRNWDAPSPFFTNYKRILKYLTQNKKINEVIISGGDPLTLPKSKIGKLIRDLVKIEHLTHLRISTRVLTFSPQVITPDLCRSLVSRAPTYLMTHFNHPAEITAETGKAIRLLRKNGIILLNQSVLLKGINDTIPILEQLSSVLIQEGVIPYALHQLDYTSTIQHFKVPVARGKKLIEAMRKDFSGIGIPHYVLDQKEGKGKRFLVL